MGNITERLVRVPNADCWIDKTAVIAVARQADSVIDSTSGQGGTTSKISVVNFAIRLIDGKSVNVQSPDRSAIKDFLHSIGVTWEG